MVKKFEVFINFFCIIINMKLRNGKKINYNTNIYCLENEIKINKIINEESYQDLYEVNIDFNHSSKCWKYNKISLGNGMYKYK
tara:strand:- start:196 stop:444 length:249 start_codon:yes stop_codon:yes gene_type:complete